MARGPLAKLQRRLLRTRPEKTIEMILFRTKVSYDTFSQFSIFDLFSLPGRLNQSHVHGPADFTDEGCASFTFALRHVENKLLEATGALRIYTSLIGKPDLIYTHT